MRELTICPQCGVTNKENSNFCEVCGEPLKKIPKICPECGTENVDIAKFCENCGKRLETLKPNTKSLKTKYMEDPDFLENKPKDNSRKVSLNLTPAESLMILDHKTHKRIPKDLFKATLIDLIFKNVFKLDVQEVEKKGIFGKKIVKKIYLEEGKNFNMPLKPHEEVFRENLPSKADSKRLKKLQQRVYGKYRNDYAKKKLLEPLALEGYFNIEKKFLGKKYSLTDKGIEIQEMILELKDMGMNLDNWIENDPERAKAYLLVGGSNIFLTDDYSFEWFKANSGKIKRLFADKSKLNAFLFFNVGWYGAFRMHKHHKHLDIDFDDFSDLDDFDDFTDFGDIMEDGFDDIFSDFDAFDAFDSMDFSDFDSGFDSGGFDGGDFGGDGGGGE